MPRFTVDFLDVLLDLLRDKLGDDVWVMSRIPDGVEDYLPLVVIRRTGGSPVRPDFYDQPWVNVQCWCADDPDSGIDQYRAASDLADQVRGIFWNAWRTQEVVPGKGHIAWYRESTSPIEISDPDLPLLGRFSATYDLRIRPAAS
jgi:hypothetical protein